MEVEQNLFEEFPEISRAEWLKKIEADLKGAAVEQLFWNLDSEISLAPIHHADDRKDKAIFSGINKKTNDWEIGAYVTIGAPKQANSEALDGLRGGVTALQLNLEMLPTDETFEQLFEQIETDYISTHLNPAQHDPVVVLSGFKKLLKQREKNLGKTRGSLCFDPLEQGDLEKAFKLLQTFGSVIPRFKLIQITAPAFSGIENITTDLAQMLAKGSELLAAFEEEGFDLELVCNHFKCALFIGTNYFASLAQVRALRILWANLASAYSLENQQIEIEVHLAPDAHKENPNDNMIQASTQAMSAALGGADRILIPPSGATQGDIFFQNRIARNVQHLLKMEAYLDRVVDPAKGSYFIENLTERIAENAWKKFQEIEAKGGYKAVF
jgi:methylmalonyl-CoA mutase